MLSEQMQDAIQALEDAKRMAVNANQMEFAVRLRDAGVFLRSLAPPPAPSAQLPSSLTAVRKKICNCAGAVGQAQGFLQGVSTCEQLLPHQRGAAEQFAKELESRWDALSAELEQLLSQQSGWRDIATAPKDGTAVLGYFPGRRGYVARQDVAPIHWVSDAIGWRNATSGHDVHDSPTHWQPLPSPPQEPGNG